VYDWGWIPDGEIMAGTVGLNYGWIYCHAQTRRLVSAHTHTGK